jgi:ABC-type transport system involved in multi-copper enzyme maturation permease subunit
MIDALRYEWVRLRTLRSTYWLTGIALLVAGLLALPALSLTDNPALSQQDYGDIITGGGGGAIFLISIFVGLLGVFAIGHEYRYGTIRPTLCAIPRRSMLMAAKLILVLVWVLVVGLVAQALRFFICWLILGSKWTAHPFDGVNPRLWIGSIGYMVVFALVGLALSGLFRSMPAAIVTLIVMPLIAENLIHGLLTIHALRSLRGIGKVLPFSAGSQIMSYPSNDDNGLAGQLVGPWPGAFIFIGFLCILMALSWTLFERRDA